MLILTYSPFPYSNSYTQRNCCKSLNELYYFNLCACAHLYGYLSLLGLLTLTDQRYPLVQCSLFTSGICNFYYFSRTTRFTFFNPLKTCCENVLHLSLTLSSLKTGSICLLVPSYWGW